MITIDFSDIDPDKIVAKCEEQIADYLEDKMTDVCTICGTASQGTPVDQGTARNGWQLDTSVKLQRSL
jgi:heptaprenylglyceryl phosphate synthase